AIVSYLWTTDPSTSGQLIDANQAIATLVIPSFRSITAILTITDDVGRTATGSVTIKSALAAATGAGGFAPLWLAVLAVALAWQLRRQRRALRCAALN
ncbi:MAG TPA: hypothetical protein VGL28_08795, partial [Steroidobacteraceae bacterium]